MKALKIGIVSLLMAILTHGVVVAHPVSLKTAKEVAIRFMGTPDVQLSTEYRTENDVVAFYVFNTNDGFVIVAADDCETPIIGYSHEGCFDPDEVPIPMEGYLQDFVRRIHYGMENHVIADEITARQWALVKTTGRLTRTKASKAVTPLITSKWHQGCLYNSLCPAIETMPCGHAEVGCVAVAMGQIMRYWNYPASGWGTHSYSNSGSEISADFGGTTYQWDLMPDSLTGNPSDAEIEAVATLLYHCGVSVDMNYNVNGSFSGSNSVPPALINYFNYSKEIHRETKDPDNAVWLSKLTDCLDLGRPVLYSGGGNDGSHAFVCDGYDGNGLLHFNWGWGGSGDGYFALGNMNPNGYSFNSYNSAIFDIVPDFDLYQVTVTVYPPESGHIDGIGEYHINEQCTLRAMPNGDYEFYYWKQNGNFLSFDTIYTTCVRDNIDDIEAYFILRPATHITATAGIDTEENDTSCITLSWANRGIRSWTLLKQFDVDHGNGIATDNEYIYISRTSGYLGSMFSKYTMDGAFVEDFEIPDCMYLWCLTYNGTYYYGFSKNDQHMYTVDLGQKQLISTTRMFTTVRACAYDATRNCIWIVTSSNQLQLKNQLGQGVFFGQILPQNIYGCGIFNGIDNNTYLLMNTQEGLIFNYNINNNSFDNLNIQKLDPMKSISTGIYDEKDALFVCTGNKVKIYEIEPNDVFSKVKFYRLYRLDEQKNELLIADNLTRTSYIDTTWAELPSGRYRYGVGSVFFDGSESEIIWSDTIVKANHGIDEYSGKAFSICPNPMGDLFSIEFPSDVTPVTVELYDLQGRRILTQTKALDRIPMEGLPSGTYLVRVTLDDGSTFSDKVVKK